VDVTRALCKYVKDEDLQNPANKRVILPDTKLKKLLKFDPKKEGKDLTYYMIQSHIQHHFIKTPPVVKA
jgi:chromatin remodeling complex protein RSC6